MKRRTLVSTAAALALLPTAFGQAANASQPDHGTAEEAVAMVERALALIEAVGLEAAIEAFHDRDNADFHDRDLYVFVVDDKGNSIAHGSKPYVAGTNFMDITDVNGDYYVRELVEVGLSGTSGWVDYWLDSPTTDTIVPKSSFVAQIDERHLIGVGIYKY